MSSRGGDWLVGPAGLKAGTRPTQEEKNPFQISFKFWIWQNFGKLYSEILKELDTGIFLKIFQVLQGFWKNEYMPCHDMQP
jgi:hypothetical protein